MTIVMMIMMMTINMMMIMIEREERNSKYDNFLLSCSQD